MISVVDDLINNGANPHTALLDVWEPLTQHLTSQVITVLSDLVCLTLELTVRYDFKRHLSIWTHHILWDLDITFEVIQQILGRLFNLFVSSPLRKSHR